MTSVQRELGRRRLLLDDTIYLGVALVAECHSLVRSLWGDRIPSVSWATRSSLSFGVAVLLMFAVTLWRVGVVRLGSHGLEHLRGVRCSDFEGVRFDVGGRWGWSWVVAHVGGDEYRVRGTYSWRLCYEKFGLKVPTDRKLLYLKSLS